ncbi:MAG: hypothetical protein HRU71_04770 [Planctomycetia bacterium]|nr:MAG: hypothetical protein HRU71_04770 [Planctomycetia bacterium]
MHRVQHQLAQPVSPARPSLATGNVHTNHHLPLNPRRRLLFAQIKRQHVRRSGLAQPPLVQSRHRCRADHADLQTARCDPLGAQHKPRRALQRTSNHRLPRINMNLQTARSLAI